MALAAAPLRTASQTGNARWVPSGPIPTRATFSKAKPCPGICGGGKKPWNQKGTGNARQGSTRSPQWVGGGRVFGPRPRSYNQDMPQKMREAALRSALSAKAAGNEIVLVDAFGLDP